MESNDELKEISTKNCTFTCTFYCYYFNDIIKVEDFDFKVSGNL